MVTAVSVLQHVPHETLGTLEQAFEAAGVACRRVPLFAQPAAEQAWDWDELAGLVVLGGPMNVDQVAEFPFLQREVDWIRQAVLHGVPVLGICLGSQLLAKALGAHGRHTVFQWHGDTFALPAGAVPLARSELCHQQAFRFGANAYGLQFHIEVTAEMVNCWLAEPQNQQELRSLDDIAPAAIRQRLPTALREMQAWGRPALARFADLCRQHGSKSQLS